MGNSNIELKAEIKSILNDPNILSSLPIGLTEDAKLRIAYSIAKISSDKQYLLNSALNLHNRKQEVNVLNMFYEIEKDYPNASLFEKTAAAIRCTQKFNYRKLCKKINGTAEKPLPVDYEQAYNNGINSANEDTVEDNFPIIRSLDDRREGICFAVGVTNGHLAELYENASINMYLDFPNVFTRKEFVKRLLQDLAYANERDQKDQKELLEYIENTANFFNSNPYGPGND